MDVVEDRAAETDIERRLRMRQRLLDTVRQSVTSAASSGRTVENPGVAAEYVVNALTVHYTVLLAEAAVTFDEDAVRSYLDGRPV